LGKNLENAVGFQGAPRAESYERSAHNRQRKKTGPFEFCPAQEAVS
jgi:hypothetical protein